ncbi:MAG: hypothetical protein XD73_0415 [Anaerolinea thermophila]|uniref:LysM domain-containing protein n=1 Tax=Anaerolinea thermophila TaxID=167964 RepID=A0A101FYC5_9CHLR|nr:MAG: hypothetical protein XD73_0415 [Anaerolinea thermophila]
MVLMVACTGGKQATYVGVGLTPYGSTTNAEAQTLAPITTGTPLPTPSPTPHYHVVAAGETMSSIAVLYGFNMKDVVDANPDINPNAMVVGMQVLIPAKPASTQEVPIAADLEPITLDDPQCYQEKSGGLWCFLTAVNENANAVENVLVEITIGDANASQLSARIAAAPLNMIPAGGEQVLSAYFPPPIPDPFRYSYQLVSSIPVEDMSRYIETKILEQSIDISNDGLTAQVSARVFMNGIVGDTVRVWLSAIAKDANGAVMGVRRIEAVTELDSLGIVEVTGFVYSVESPIEEVALQAEAIYTQ